MLVAAVESTSIATVAYDQARELLQLEFCSRAIYQYVGVPASTCGAAERAVQGPLLQSDHSGTLSLSSGHSIQLKRAGGGNPGQALPVGMTYGAHRGGVAGWQPDYRLYQPGRNCQILSPRKNREVSEKTDRASIREPDLPAHVVIFYVIALALYMRSSYREVLRCLLEGVQWLLDPSAKAKVAGKSGISQARSRLGAAPLRKLYDAVVAPC